MPPLLTEAETADVLRISPRTLRTLRGKGLIKYVRIGRKVMYSENDVADFIERHTVQERPRAPTSNVRIASSARKRAATMAKYESLFSKRPKR